MPLDLYTYRHCKPSCTDRELPNISPPNFVHCYETKLGRKRLPEYSFSLVHTPPTPPAGTSHCQFSSSETYTARSQKSWHSFANRSLVQPGLISCIALQLLSLLWLPSIAVWDVIRMKQSDWSVTIVTHGTKTE